MNSIDTSALYRIQHSVDDFVVCFQHKDKAEKFYDRLWNRLKHFGLQIEEKKRRLINLADLQKQMSERKACSRDLQFLGFTHYCSKAKNGKF